jgi:Cof subfamily protein (haloacid dehalogenase superfamily)
MSNKIIFFDVDGTLIDCASGLQCVPDSTRKAIESIKKNGNLAVLATGRPKSFLGDNLLELQFDAYITSNGTYIEKNNNILYNRQIDSITLKEAIELFKSMNLEFILESQNCAYFSNLNVDYICKYIKKYSIPEKNITDKWNISSVVSNKMVVFTTNIKQIENCVKHIGDKFNFMNHPGEKSFDINLKNCTKADGIERLLAYLNISIEDTYAVGDGINDIEMFQKVNYGIAMGNANEKLKKVATFVTTDIYSNGIYNALKKYNLIEKLVI